jgi:hypothetical protein
MRHAIIFVVLISGMLALAAGKILTGPYYYDEADYMVAASLGFFSNWMDAGTLPIVDFVKIGLNRGASREQRLALSELARKASDPVVYRHWHGPLYFYWLAILAPRHLAEGTVRTFSLVFPILTAIVLYFGTLRILPAPAAQPAAILSCALFLWGQMTVKTTELAPHMLFILCYVSALLLLAAVMEHGDRRPWYAAVIASGLACCTLEVAFALVATLVVCAWLRRRELAAGWAFAGNSVLTLGATVLLVWPAAILKLSFIKAYFAMAYLAIFRKSPWGEVGFLQTWAIRFTNSPVEWILIAAALIAFFATRLWRSLPALVPFAVYSVLILLAVLRVNAEGPRYMTPFFPALLILAGWAAGWMLARGDMPGGTWLRYGSVAAICLLLFWTTRRQIAGYLLHEDPYQRATIAAIQARGLASKTLLVPQVYLPTLHYYFPQAVLHSYLDPAEIPRALDAEPADAVLYPDYPVRLEIARPSTP